ncbi:MAG: ABC transporter permease [Bacteroides sp.]|nr:ABC transporter permease [Bacteroides sp.]
MNIYKAYIKLIPTFLPSILLYVGIFAVLLIMTMNASKDEAGMGVVAVGDFSVRAAVFDEDNSAESEALVKFMEDNPNILLIEVKPENLQDSLFYRKIHYALTINKGYGESLRIGNTNGILSSRVINSSTSAAFFESTLSSYISCADLYLKGGCDIDTALTETAKQLENGISLKSYRRENGWREENSTVFYFFNYLPYILFMLILQTLVPTFTAFMNDDLRSRTLCSPIRPVSYTAQIIAGALTVSAGIIALLLGAGVIITGGSLSDFLFSRSTLQVLVFALICIAVSVLVGVLFSDSKKTTGYITSMISNVLGLGMSFLCGVFVRQSLLGEEILNIGKLLPAYWYVRANNLIMGADNTVYDEKEILSCIGVQLLFAAAIFAAALLVSGLKKGKRNS